MITTPETYFDASLFKRCTKCKREKPLEEFNRNTAVKDGRRPDCRDCQSERMRRWCANPENRAKAAEYQRRPDIRAKMAEAVRRYRQTPKGRAKLAEYKRRWMEDPENRAKDAEAQRRWRQTPEGRAKLAEAARRWYSNPENRAKQIKRICRRRQTDPQVRLANLLRVRLRHALKGTVKSARTMELLGCQIEHLVKHLESKFLPGMSWQNHGEWHVDHIKPLASFNLTDPHQQREACHWTNLQPLWAADNIRKGDKL